MAVFLINICKFNGCGITFPSLGDLIQHIEDTHIDYDPKVVEQKEQAQPACLPLSYVLRFISDAARKDNAFLGSNGVELKRKLAIKHHSYSLSSSNRSNTPTGSELDEDEMIVSESEDSNDSWTTEEFSSEFIMRYGSRHSGSSNGTPGNEKPFACPVPGCKKRYKNVNGIKYHSKNGHKKDGKVRKGYKCHCGKSYKTAQGLKSHALVAHNASPDNVTNVLVRSTSPSQSLGSLSPSSISNMSSSNGSCNNINQSTNSNCITQAPPPPPPPTLQQQQQQQQTPQIINAGTQVAHLTSGGSIQQHTPVVTTNSINQSIAAPTVTATNHLMRSNIGLISIKPSSKTNASNLIAANVAASKILKLANSVNNGNAANTILEGSATILENGKLKFDACTTATTSTTPTAKTMTLPNLVNLGILTPATSPNNKSQQHTTTTFQTSSGATVTTCGGVSVLSSLNLNNSSSTSAAASASASASSSSTSSLCTTSSNSTQSLNNQGIISNSSINMNHSSSNLLDSNTTSLPLTPISPNVVQQTKTVTVASVATGTTGNGVGLTISTANGTASIVGSIHLATTAGGLDET